MYEYALCNTSHLSTRTQKHGRGLCELSYSDCCWQGAQPEATGAGAATCGQSPSTTRPRWRRSGGACTGGPSRAEPAAGPSATGPTGATWRSPSRRGPSSATATRRRAERPSRSCCIRVRATCAWRSPGVASLRVMHPGFALLRVSLVTSASPLDIQVWIARSCRQDRLLHAAQSAWHCGGGLVCNLSFRRAPA